MRKNKPDDMDLLRQKFERCVIRKDGCWGWNGGKNAHGYGRMHVRGHSIQSAHRASYVLFVGPITPGMNVCHTCDNPECSNPDHLFLGSHRDNMQDCIRKGRFVHVSHNGESNGRAKLTPEIVKMLRLEYRKGMFNASRYARELGVSDVAVALAAKGVTWKDVV
jgi:hypothetical protein